MDCECGCGRKAARVTIKGVVYTGTLSWACYKQRKRTGSTVRKKPQHGTRHPSRRARVLEAALDLTDADDIDRAMARLRKAISANRRKKNTVQKTPKASSQG